MIDCVYFHRSKVLTIDSGYHIVNVNDMVLEPIFSFDRESVLYLGEITGEINTVFNIEK